jgi:hypothetical protein
MYVDDNLKVLSGRRKDNNAKHVTARILIPWTHANAQQSNQKNSFQRTLYFVLIYSTLRGQELFLTEKICGLFMA